MYELFDFQVEVSLVPVKKDVFTKNIHEGLYFVVLTYFFKEKLNFLITDPACEKGLKDDVEFYISEVNTVNKDGQTPLLIGKTIKLNDFDNSKIFLKLKQHSMKTLR